MTALPGITGLVNSNPTQPIGSSQLNRRNYKLHRIPGFSGYGISINSNLGGTVSHKITQIAPYSPAAQQGKMKYKQKTKSSIIFEIIFLRSSCWRLYYNC
jgi:hypothetical protein